MRVAGNYPSILRGVASLTEDKRLNVYQQDMLNLYLDNTGGLSRRPGISYEGFTDLGTKSYFTIGTLDYSIIDINYNFGNFDLLYNTKPSEAKPIILWERDAPKPILVKYNTDDLETKFKTNGIISATHIGNIIYFAINNNKPKVDSKQLWVEKEPKRYVIEISQVLYDHKYSLTFKPNIDYDEVVRVEYKTMSKEYPGNIQGIPTGITPNNELELINLQNQQQKDYINKRTAYNVEVSNTVNIKHIASQIAEQIKAKVIAITADCSGNYIYINLNNSPAGGFISTDTRDALKVYTNVVTSVANLPNRYFTNGVIKVTNGESDDSVLYMKATTELDYGEVTWEECPKIEFTISNLLALGCIHTENDTTNLIIASNPQELTSLVPGLELKDYEKNKMGNFDLKDLPKPILNGVTFLSTVQNRLVLGWHNILLFSKSGEYHNFFQESAFKVQVTDAFTLSKVTSDDDNIKSIVAIGGRHLLFSDKYIYGLNSHEAITPMNANLSVLGKCAGDLSSNVAVLLNKAYYTYVGDVVYVGQVYFSDAKEHTLHITNQTQLVNGFVTVPIRNMVFISSLGMLVGVQSMTKELYIANVSQTDNSNGQDNLPAWHRWEMNSTIAAVSSYGYGLLLYTIHVPTDATQDIKLIKGTIKNLNTGQDYWDYYNVINTEESPSPLGLSPQHYTSKLVLSNPYIYDDNGMVSTDDLVSIITKTCAFTENSHIHITLHDQTKNTLYTNTVKPSENISNIAPYRTKSVLIPIFRNNKRYTLSLESIDDNPFNILGVSFVAHSYKRR